MNNFNATEEFYTLPKEKATDVHATKVSKTPSRRAAPKIKDVTNKLANVGVSLKPKQPLAEKKKHNKPKANNHHHTNNIVPKAKPIDNDMAKSIHSNNNNGNGNGGSLFKKGGYQKKNKKTNNNGWKNNKTDEKRGWIQPDITTGSQRSLSPFADEFSATTTFTDDHFNITNEKTKETGQEWMKRMNTTNLQGIIYLNEKGNTCFEHCPKDGTAFKLVLKKTGGKKGGNTQFNNTDNQRHQYDQSSVSPSILAKFEFLLAFQASDPHTLRHSRSLFFFRSHPRQNHSPPGLWVPSMYDGGYAYQQGVPMEMGYVVGQNGGAYMGGGGYPGNGGWNPNAP
ncbi:MAG: hypothetical protein SGARI_003836, partial [Bacillariaceae sp.]